MTQDEVIEMAKDAGFDGVILEMIAHTYKLGAENEREACAKVCEDREEAWRKAGFWGTHHEFREMAFAIRARGEA